jgi:hypothetical protein
MTHYRRQCSVKDRRAQRLLSPAELIIQEEAEGRLLDRLHRLGVDVVLDVLDSEAEPPRYRHCATTRFTLPSGKAPPGFMIIRSSFSGT